MGISPTQDDESAVLKAVWAVSHTHWARFNPSFLFLTLLQDGVWLQLWSQLTASSSVSVSLFWRAHRFPLLSQTHPRCSLDRVQIGEGRAGWVRIEVISQLRRRKNKPLLYSVLLLLPLLSYTCIHTHTRTCYQVLTSSEGSGRQFNFLNTFPYSQCWIFVVVGILNGNFKKCNRSDSLEHSGFLKDGHMFYHVNLQLI